MEFNIMEFFKLPVKVMSAISLAFGLILFLPDEVITKMYMSDFRNTYGFIIGAVFIVSTSILIVTIIINGYKSIRSIYMRRKFNKNKGKLLRTLDPYKRMLVYGLYEEENHTFTLPLNDGAVVFLENMMVIQKATSQYAVSDIVNPVFPYFLQPWVVKELESDEELLLSYKRDAENTMIKMKNERQNNGDYDYY